MKPRISVHVPVARIDQFLIDTFRSIQNQTFKDYEVILVVDENNLKKLKVLIDSEFTFAYRIIPTKLSGVAFAANLAIANTDSEFIARWDSDDLCDPIRLEAQVKEFDGDLALGVLGTKVKIVDEYGVENPFHSYPFYQDNASIRRALKYRTPILHSSMMIRSELMFVNKGYLYGHTSEDSELLMRIARDKSVVFRNLDSVTTYYRRHQSQLSNKSYIKTHFYERASFLFGEFLRTFDPIYIVAILANHPLARNIRHYRRLIAERLS